MIKEYRRKYPWKLTINRSIRDPFVVQMADFKRRIPRSWEYGGTRLECQFTDGKAALEHPFHVEKDCFIQYRISSFIYQHFSIVIRNDYTLK